MWYSSFMIHIEGHAIWKDGEKIGYIEGEKIYSREARKLGWISKNHIYNYHGKKVAWVEKNHIEMEDGKRIELDDIHEYVEGGAISDVLRTAVYLFLNN